MKVKPCGKVKSPRSRRRSKRVLTRINRDSASRFSASLASVVLAVLIAGSGFALFTGIGSARASPIDTSGANVAVSGASGNHSTPIAQLSDGANYSRGNLSEESSLEPLANTILRDYNWMGYNGNGSIYPTLDTQPYPLPTLSRFGFQTASNSSIGCGSGCGLVNTNLLNISTLPYEYPRFGDLGPNWGNQFVVWIWVTSTGGADPFDTFPDGCNDAANSFIAYGIDVAAMPSGLPGSGTNSFYAGNNTGTNTTTGNLGDSGSRSLSLTQLVGFGLTVASALFPEAGVPLTVAGAAFDLAEFTGPDGPTSNAFVASSPDVAGNLAANEVGLVTNGTVSNGCTGYDAGKNIFTQAAWIQEEVQPTGLPQVTPGSLQLTSSNVLEFDDSYCPSCSYVEQGSSPSVTYPIGPASSLGGTVSLWNNGPPATGAQVTVQQQEQNESLFQNLEETTTNTGQWHAFIRPTDESDGPSWTAWYSQWWSDFSNALGSTSNSTSPVPQSDWTAGSNGLLNVALDGGEVRGNITSVGGGTVSGASVKLCNNNGCISTMTSSAGQYALQFPIAGTSSNPYTITINAPGQPQTGYGPYDLPVGQYTSLNLEFVQTMGIDGSAIGSSVGSNSAKATLSTTKSNDAIVVELVASISSGSVSGCSDSSGLSWVQREAFTPGSGTGFQGSPWVFEWYAIAPHALLSDTITCTMSVSTNPVMVVFGVSGEKTTSPFDPNTHVPCTVQGGSTVNCEDYVTEPEDLVIGLVASYHSGSVEISPSSGATQIQQTDPGPYSMAEYEITYGTEGVQMGASDSGSSGMAMIEDALQV
jgi:hypothetical protein